MASFTIRDISDETNNRLKIQAGFAGLSREAYVRWLLNAVAQHDPLSGKTIKLDPPLPCGKLTGTQQCGNPAKAALAWPGPTPGQWALLPMCKQCVELTAQLYK